MSGEPAAQGGVAIGDGMVRILRPVGHDGSGATGGGLPDLLTSGLNEIAAGLTLALGELKAIGLDAAAGAGRGFSQLELSGLELGHEGLTDTFHSFCERWEWGVRSLVNEGNALAKETGMAAGTYYENDQYVSGTMKVALNSVVGDPHASEEQVAHEGWGEIATQTAHPDYSKESFEHAYRNSLQGWKDAGRDVMTSHSLGVPGLSPEELAKSAGVSDAAYDQMLDDVYGPSPEERARLQQGGGQG
ncbi:hypothetical protein ACL02U_29740 [Streptomyces sp. MS06]|uniref:hypothetical protein n=1 Tax=Streptomyces sp. MS06 TaxID=3385974 RepID=UPI0039A18E06